MNVVSFPTRLNPTQSLSCLGVLSHNWSQEVFDLSDFELAASGNTTSRVCRRCRSGEMLGSRYASEIPALGHDLGWRRNLCSWKQRKNSGIPTLSFCSKNESNPLSKPFMIYNPGSSQIWGGWTHLSWSLSRCRRKGEKSWSNLPSNG